MGTGQPVDNGIMRLNECQQVKETLAKHLGISLTVVDASQRFLETLKGVADPEQKRKKIGSLFVRASPTLCSGEIPRAAPPLERPRDEIFDTGI